ncbi:MAG: carnitinyl-CoA dehydratase, partial [Rhizobiales bacterium]|nr:carnitinyl-CoA dehydratase [Hyphomicrobiales bacterium]
EMLKVEEAYALIRSGKVPAYEAIFASEDAKEGPLAFAEGREPKWSGQ